MPRMKQFDYFDAYLQLTDCCKQSATFIQNILACNPIALNPQAIQELHEIENVADSINHTIHERLYADFVVPLERDNMVQIANDLDDIVDAIEEIAIRLYIYHIYEADDTIRQMAQLIEQSVTSLHDAIRLLASSKKDGNINTALIAIHDAEDKGDKLYIEALYALYDQNDITGETRQLTHRVYDTFENVLDRLEHTAEDIQSIITQNI